jgi:hypothetical protein
MEVVMHEVDTATQAEIGEALLAELRKITTEQAPALFALREQLEGSDLGVVEYWGMAFDDRAEVVDMKGATRGSFRSAESAHRLFSVSRPLHLLWV